MDLANDGTLIPPSLAIGNALYLTGEDSLKVTSFGSTSAAVLAVRHRLVALDGELAVSAERHVPNSDRSIATSFHPLPEGWLSGVEVFASSAAPRIGNVYVVVELARGIGGSATTLQELWSGYVTDTTPAGWPATPSRRSTDGPGVIRVIQGTNPAAGVEIAETCPTNARWRLRSMAFILVTAAVATNREVNLLVDDGANGHFVMPSGSNQGTTLTWTYCFAQQAVRGVSAAGTTVVAPIADVILMGGHRFRTSTTNLQGADDFSAPVYEVEEWIED